MARQVTVYRLSLTGALLVVLLTLAACTAPESSERPSDEVGSAVTAEPGGKAGQSERPAPSSGQIAFISDRGGQVDLWLMNADGSGAQRLTDNPAQEMFPAWSPDRSKIAYTSANGDVANLWIIEVANGRSVEVAKGVGLQMGQIRWSTDGRSILYGGSAGQADSSWPALFAAGESVPTKVLLSKSGKTLRAWSLAAGRVAAEFRSGLEGGIYIQNVAAETDPAGQGIKEIDGSDPVLSPDGRLLAYKGPPGDDDPVLWVVDLQSGKKTAIDEKAAGRRWDQGAAWAPDGKRLAFARSSIAWPGLDGRLAVHGQGPAANASDEGIYIAAVDGGAVKRLTKSSYDSAPTWSADGSWIAFVSARGRESGSDIWAADVSGELAVNLTARKGSSWSPAWSPK